MEMSICGKREKEGKSERRDCNGNKKRNRRDSNSRGKCKRSTGEKVKSRWENLESIDSIQGKKKDLRKALEGLIEERKEENLCIGGDFNARIGRKGRKCERGEDDELGRISKDKVINSEVKELLDMIEERGWEIENGNTWGDKENGLI